MSRKRETACYVDCGGDYSPGDPPPEGYCQWHEWAQVQYKAGLRQQRCGICSLWKFPQELSGETLELELFRSDGAKVNLLDPICKDCQKQPDTAEARKIAREA